ncbi:hypothetical protein LINGRAPRIM_LOCUS2624, partial [Linum grandiflorum]
GEILYFGSNCGHSGTLLCCFLLVNLSLRLSNPLLDSSVRFFIRISFAGTVSCSEENRLAKNSAP